MTAGTGTAVQLEGITKTFGDVTANDGVDFGLDWGSIHAIVGENGAGKTTLMNVLYGLYRPDAGTIAVDGHRVTFDTPNEAIDAGIGMIHQHFMLVDNMTVLQNVVLGHEPDGRFGVVDRARARDDIREISASYGFEIDEYLDANVGDIGVGVEQRVEIVKTLYRGAEILILDEPTAVLAPHEVDQLFEVMEELADQGHALIFITHKLDEAMSISDEITVLRDGKRVGSVDSESTSRDELAKMMVGRNVLFDVEKTAFDPGDRLLEVEGLQVSDDRGLLQVDGVDFTIREGEVFGIAGVEGNGQSELVDAITGLRKPDSGTISYKGTDVTGRLRRQLIRSGIAFIPEDRLERGLILDYDLVENSLLGNQTVREFRDGRFIDWGAVNRHAEAIVDRYDVNPPDVSASARSFSGGNQQKFVIGREFEHDPDLVVASHPTRGVDVGSIEFIRQRLLEMRDAGTGILLVSSKLDEVQQLSDRLAVIFDGEIVDVVDPSEVTEQELGLMMTGERRSGVDGDGARDSGRDHQGGETVGNQ